MQHYAKGYETCVGMFIGTQSLLIKDDRNRRRLFKSDERVGHFNAVLARGGGNVSDSIFKSSSARAFSRMCLNIFCFNC